MSSISRHVAPAADARSSTVVGAGVVVHGGIEGWTDLHVHGEVIGKVAVSDLLLEAGATVRGPVTATTVAIRGTVVGDVEATTLRLSSGARVAGDVSCVSLQVEPGARIEGRCVSAADVIPDADPGERTDHGQELVQLAGRLRRFSAMGGPAWGGR